ncbi:secreted RxLR effector protein 161-like [Lathyrus oleraceus]|uniref:secreted RxLR effector protein 161-like n=1 Tax=Pisum sativum TaxID=3888 RepID=UPI0021CE680A|nr:secreted RxLR effector protein 161-like [Pisum sativum]
MSDYNTATTPLKIGAKLKKETNDEFVSATLYKKIIGSLRFMENPQKCYLVAVKRVSRCIKSTIDHGVLMSRKKNVTIDTEVHGYTNLDFNGDQNEKKSIVGYIFMIGGVQISWSSRKQNIVALSSCEGEYVVTSYVIYQTTWIEMLLEELKIMKPKKMKLFVNNKSVISLANHPVCHG